MIPLKTPQEISIMREGGRRLARLLREVSVRVRPGITTKELDRAAEALILQSGAKPAFKGYEEFPATLCASVNEEVVHAIPSNRVLQEGDIVTLDLGLIFRGFYLDMARTLPVGNINPEVQRLIDITNQSLQIGMQEVKKGNTFGDIGYAIQQYVEKQGYNVVRDLCGHGIGKDLHEEPQVLNYGKRGEGETIEEGMVFCIEPMVTIGDWHVKQAADGYGFVTKDGSLSCHFEDTVVLTSSGPEILTKESGK